MATLPYFIVGPNTALSILGLLYGADETTPTPVDDWRAATVDVIIPALNEAEHIVLCLASLLRQTHRPRSIILVDDGSTDATVVIAEAYCRFSGVDLVTIRRRKSIGKTPTLKRQARELDSDVEFILDGDTVLESENYIARAVEELYKGQGVASACGTVLPLRRRDRLELMERPECKAFIESSGRIPRLTGRWRGLATGITNVYREVLNQYLQRFIYKGQLAFFGTISNPVGCAVAYRRKYVKDLFDHFGPQFGDDLTNSEDIFIGMAMLDKGYRNVHLTDVHARTAEPPIHRLAQQVYLWSSAFLQSCYYFDPLVKSPFREARRRWNQGWLNGRARVAPTKVTHTKVTQLSPAPATAGLGPMFYTSVPPLLSLGHGKSHDSKELPRTTPTPPREGAELAPLKERRYVAEPYRQAFGRERTIEFGRPAGWMLTMSAMEKVLFPTAIVIMILLRYWEALAVTLVAETTLGLVFLMVVMRGQRLEYLAKGLVVVPIRYLVLAVEFFTIGRFSLDLWVTKERGWRK